MKKKEKGPKPKLRGYIHQESFFFSLGACLLLIAKSSDTLNFTASITYSFGLLFMFGVSAFYHRPHWEPKPRAFLKRVDHSAIFILIASTATPLCLLALSEESGFSFMKIIWSCAVLGIFQSIFWVRAPKYITSLFYVAMGWTSAPYIAELRESLGDTQVSLIIIGGVIYSVGALFYAFKKPNLKPNVFGYHELFHLFTFFGAALHFIAIYQLIQ